MDKELQKALERLGQLAMQVSADTSEVKAAATPPGDAAAAAGANGAGVVARSLKETTVENINPLRKCFEELGAANVGWNGLTTEKALGDPVGTLRQKSVHNPGAFAISDGKLGGMIATLLQKGAGKEGMSLGDWMDKSGKRAAIETAFEGAIRGKGFGGLGDVVERAIDTASGGVLIRTDIAPLLYEAYLRQFPVLEAIPVIPSNGLVHTYNVRTGVGTAKTVGELGDLATTDSQSTYERKAQANIAVLATRRAISLKAQFAVGQSGMGNAFDLTGPDNLEVSGGITAVAKLDQTLACQGNYSVADKTLNDEEGLSDALGYDGLRYLLRDASTSINKGADTYLRVLNKAIAQIANSGGNVNEIVGLMGYGARMAVDEELLNFLRILNGAGGGVNSSLSQAGITTVANTLQRFMSVPMGAQNEGMGYYTYSAATTEDIFVVDPNGVQMAYLGSPTPVVLELPVGFNGMLSNVYIIFTMHGLVVFIPKFHRKIRIPRQVV